MLEAIPPYAQGVCVNDPIVFNGNFVRPDTSVVRWRWNFGDGDTSTVQNPIPQFYSNAGNYNINVVATNSSGCATPFTLDAADYPPRQVIAGSNTAIYPECLCK